MNILTVRGVVYSELTAQYFAQYLDVPAQLSRESLLLYILDCSFASEQIDGHTRRQESLMLLPLQRLSER